MATMGQVFLSESVEELSEMEAMHVHGVLRTTLEKLALIGAIKIDPQAQADEMTLSVGEEVTKMIAEMRRLEKQFKSLVDRKHMLSMKPTRSKQRESQVQRALLRVSHCLRLSTKKLCRNLKDNPNVTDNMAKVSSIRQQLCHLFTQCLNDLEAERKAICLLETVHSFVRKEVDTKQTIDRERHITAAVRHLRNDLKDEKVDHEEKMREKRKALLVLKEQLKEVKIRTTIETRYLAKDVQSSNECMKQLAETDVCDLERQLELVRHQTEIERAVHEAAADHLKARGAWLQEQSVKWGHKSDEDLMAKESDIQVLKANHQRDLGKLRDLQDQYKEELSLKNGRELNEKRKKDEADAMMMDTDQKRRAATMIQAMYRGFMARKELKGKKGAKKGGKGKKGKKK